MSGDRSIEDLRKRRDSLAEQLVELQWDLGGIAYEMAIRDHFRLDVLNRQAAKVQQVDAELAEVERMLKLDQAGAAGACGYCGALYARGRSVLLAVRQRPDAAGLGQRLGVDEDAGRHDRAARTVLRASRLVVTDRRWAATLAAMALGFGLFLGVAIGPGAAGTLRHRRGQIVAVAPSSAEAALPKKAAPTTEPEPFTEPESEPFETEEAFEEPYYPETEYPAEPAPEEPVEEAVPTEEPEEEKPEADSCSREPSSTPTRPPAATRWRSRAANWSRSTPAKLPRRGPS